MVFFNVLFETGQNIYFINPSDITKFMKLNSLNDDDVKIINTTPFMAPGSSVWTPPKKKKEKKEKMTPVQKLNKFDEEITKLEYKLEKKKNDKEMYRQKLIK